MEIDEHLKYTLYVGLSKSASASPKLTACQPAIRPMPSRGRADGLETHARLLPLIDHLATMDPTPGRLASTSCYPMCRRMLERRGDPAANSVGINHESCICRHERHFGVQHVRRGRRGDLRGRHGHTQARLDPGVCRLLVGCRYSPGDRRQAAEERDVDAQCDRLPGDFPCAASSREADHVAHTTDTCEEANSRGVKRILILKSRYMLGGLVGTSRCPALQVHYAMGEWRGPTLSSARSSNTFMTLSVTRSRRHRPFDPCIRRRRRSRQTPRGPAPLSWHAPPEAASRPPVPRAGTACLP